MGGPGLKTWANIRRSFRSAKVRRLVSLQLKLHFQAAVEASAEGREAEDFGVFFVEQIFDPAG